MLDLNQPESAHIDQRLRTDPIIWLNTARPDGRPHTVAVWFLWDGESFLIFSRPRNQKLRNIQHNANVTLALDDTKAGSDVIVIEGKATLINDPDVQATVSTYAQKYASLLNEMGWTAESMASDYSQGIRVVPTRLVG